MATEQGTKRFRVTSLGDDRADADIDLTPESLSVVVELLISLTKGQGTYATEFTMTEINASGLDVGETSWFTRGLS